MRAKDIPIPQCWPQLVRKAMLHASALARWDMIYVHSLAADHDIADVRWSSMIEQRDHEIAMLREELRIVSGRWDKITPRRRPRYSPVARLSILLLKAQRGWKMKTAATHFGLTDETLSSWMRELEVEGSESLVQTSIPINKYPDFVQEISQSLKALCPLMGKKRIAEYFARAGLHLGATTIGRKLQANPIALPDDTPPAQTVQTTTHVTARHPNHVWHIDLTAVPVGKGLSTTWLPNSLPTVWPFCWWTFVIVDHFSRRCLGFALFKKLPTTAEVTGVLDRAVRRHGKPKHIISDKGSQFWSPGKRSVKNCVNHPYHVWCRLKNIETRFGAVGQHGSIAIVERFIRTLKHEGLNLVVVPLSARVMREELSAIITWYNDHRPHQALQGRTPLEVHSHSPPAAKLDIMPNSELLALTLELSYFEGRKHLPVVEIRQAA